MATIAQVGKRVRDTRVTLLISYKVRKKLFYVQARGWNVDLAKAEHADIETAVATVLNEVDSKRRVRASDAIT